MELRSLHDRATIEAFLRRDARLHLYELGDVDDFFFPYTTWWGLYDQRASAATEDRIERIVAIALLYAATELPVLVVLAPDEEKHFAVAMLERLAPLLPRRFYAHLAVGAAGAIRGYRAEHRGLHHRMILVDPRYLDEVDPHEAVTLGPRDAHELEAFYASAYPSHWFDPRMLATGVYRGVRRDGRIVSAAGVHVFSRTKRVAAIGNVATNSAYRGLGLARVVCTATCRTLLDAHVDVIGLNVLASEASTIRLYEALGFVRTASYEEVAFEIG